MHQHNTWDPICRPAYPAMGRRGAFGSAPFLPSRQYEKQSFLQRPRHRWLLPKISRALLYKLRHGKDKRNRRHRTGRSCGQYPPRIFPHGRINCRGRACNTTSLALGLPVGSRVSSEARKGASDTRGACCPLVRNSVANPATLVDPRVCRSCHGTNPRLFISGIPRMA